MTQSRRIHKKLHTFFQLTCLNNNLFQKDLHILLHMLYKVAALPERCYTKTKNTHSLIECTSYLVLNLADPIFQIKKTMSKKLIRTNFFLKFRVLKVSCLVTDSPPLTQKENKKVSKLILLFSAFTRESWLSYSTSCLQLFSWSLSGVSCWPKI